MVRSLVVLSVLAAVAASAQDRSPFTVAVETPEGAPVAGASVLLGASGGSTDADGEVVFPAVRPGRHVLRVSFVGRETREAAVTLEAPGPWELAVELAPAARPLGDVVVEARTLDRSALARDGFFERARMGAGTILTAEDIARKAPVALDDVLRGEGGLRVQRTRRGFTVAVAKHSGYLVDTFTNRDAERLAVEAEENLQGCVMDVYLDGAPAAWLTEDLPGLSARGLVAVEIYRGPAQVPSRYAATSGTCGVILVWTETSTAGR